MSQAQPQSSTFRPRVLLIAEQCNPEWVSIPLEGWSHSRAIRQLTNAHLVTQIRNRKALLQAGLIEGKDFTAIDSEALMKPIYQMATEFSGGKGKGWTMLTAGSSLGYYYFDKLVWGAFGDDLRAGKYDLVHRLTPMSPTAPNWTLLNGCVKANIPFIIGPLNGGLPWPKGFDSVRRAEREWLSYVRGLFRLLPGIQSTYRHAAAIAVGSEATRDQMPSETHDRLFYIPENAIESDRFTARRTRRRPEQIRAVFLGRLVPYKGPDMLIEALAPLLKSGKLTLSIIGDGPMRGQLDEMIERLGVTDQVKFIGWVPHAEVQNRLAEHDLLTFPSIREFGGAVALEAMAVGLVPIVVGYGGPAELVTPAVGLTVPIGPREKIIAEFRTAVASLLDDPERIERLAEAGLRRAHELFTWDAKAKMVYEMYRWVLGDRPDRPEYPIPLPDPA